MNDQRETQQGLPPVDQTRRRLTRAGLAAPAVLGVLASRPVLGQSLHNCTPSGHISGFASPNPNGTVCATLGKTPDYYAAGPSVWPGGNGGEFINSDGSVRLFRRSPDSIGLLFADAYVVKRNSNNTVVRDATLWDMLKGRPVNPGNGNPQTNFYLTTKDGFTDDALFTLGKEAIAAAMNAVNSYPAGFPIEPIAVVRMFNNVITTGGTDPVTSNATWNAAEVIEYFQSLHA